MCAAVHNVGTNIRKPTVQYSDDDYSLVMATNLESAYKLSQVPCELLCPATQNFYILELLILALLLPFTKAKCCCCHCGHYPCIRYPVLWSLVGLHAPLPKYLLLQRCRHCLLLQAAYPLLKAAGSARMILLSSVAGGPTALRSGTIYAMTKGTFCLLVSANCDKITVSTPEGANRLHAAC